MTVSTHGNPSLRRQRTYWFIGLGSSAIFPIAHMLIRDGVSFCISRPGISWTKMLTLAFLSIKLPRMLSL